MVHALLPDDAEVAGLLALMLLTDARRAARTGADGELIPLDEQDRALWDRAAIAEGVALISAALPSGAVGAYQLQAAIAAVHDEAPRAEDTDWPQILALYGVLERMADNPMVALNRAVAAAMVHGPRAGLELLATLAGDPRLRGHYRLAPCARTCSRWPATPTPRSRTISPPPPHGERSRARLPERAGRAARGNAPLVRRSPSPYSVYDCPFF